MTLPLDATRLSQILEQEKKLGYANKSVFGGLDLFLSNWFGQALLQISQPSRLKAFLRLHPPTFSYGALTTQEREKWIDSLLTFVKQQEAASQASAKATTNHNKESLRYQKSSIPANSDRCLRRLPYKCHKGDCWCAIGQICQIRRAHHSRLALLFPQQTPGLQPVADRFATQRRC